jgi:hypothetical protein
VRQRSLERLERRRELEQEEQEGEEEEEELEEEEQSSSHEVVNQCYNWPLKGIDRPFGGGFESILIRSILVNWRLGYFFNLILNGLRHKISKKPLDAA